MFVDLALGGIVIAIALAAVRLVRGPGLTNRVVALDVIAVLAAALMAVLAIRYDQPVLLDITMILALVSFAGTIAFAYYIEKGAR